MLKHILVADPVEGHYGFYLTSTEDPVDYGETVDYIRKRFMDRPSERVFEQWVPYSGKMSLFVAFCLTDEEYRRMTGLGLEIGFLSDDGILIPRIVSREQELVFTKKVVVSEKTIKRDRPLQVMNLPI